MVRNSDANNETIEEDGSTTVFFSYSRKDQKRALPIIKAIENLGYRVWWDGMLEGGTTFLETTEEALETAKAVVVLWSSISVNSHWVRDEATSGRVRNRLVPLTLDGTMPPLGFRQIQMIDFSNWKGAGGAVAVQELSHVLAKLHGEPVSADIPTPLMSPSKGVSRRYWLGGAAVLAAGAAGLFMFNRTGSNVTGAQHGNTVAIMPFRNLSNDPNVDYLASGLASELRSNLARNNALQVAARLSSEAISKESLSAQEVSQKLGVSRIVEGQIEKIGSLIRLTTELIDGRSGFTADAKVFEHSLDEVIKFRDEIVRSISTLLTVSMAGDLFGAQNGATQNAAAFNEYLKGLDIFLSNRGVEPVRHALGHIDTALSFDPDFGQAHAVRARMLLYLGGTATDSDTARLYFDQATAEARTAVQLSPKLPEAHSTLGNILFSANLDLQGARPSYVKARELGAGDAGILRRYAAFMAVTGEHGDAQKAIQKARELDPLNLTMHRVSGLVNFSAGQHVQAAENYKHIISVDPDYWGAHARLGMAQFFMGQTENALMSCENERNDMERLPCQAIALAKRDEPVAAQKAFDALVEKYGDAGAYQQAQILSQWGEVDQALDVLELAVELGDSGLTYAYTDPALDPLRQQTRFKTILETIGFLE